MGLCERDSEWLEARGPRWPVEHRKAPNGYRGYRNVGQGNQLRKKSLSVRVKKRLTLALDGETYRRLRMHAAETDQTHQDILETALAEYLKRANA